MNEDMNSEAISAAEKLERQNQKLRAELKELTAALDNAKKRQRHAKVPQLSDLTEDKETVTVNSRINKLKQEINRMKKELEGNLNINKITDLENHSALLSKRIEELESEHLSLKKVEKEQQKALNSAHSSNTYPEKISKLKEDIRIAKEKYRDLVSKQKQDEKVHKAQHEKCVDLEEKCRKLYESIKKKKTEDEENKKKGKNEDVEVTEEILRQLEVQIKETEAKNAEEEARMKKKIRDLEGQVREGKHNLEMLKIRLKEKDQECRLSMLKIKELKKAVKHNQLRPLVRNQDSYTPKLLPPGRSVDARKDTREEPEEKYGGRVEDEDQKPDVEKRNEVNDKSEEEVFEEEFLDQPEQVKPVEAVKMPAFSKPNFNF